MGQKNIFKITGMESVPYEGVFRGFSYRTAVILYFQKQTTGFI